MAFNQPQSGWTAMSLAPNPDLFAAATNNINRVSSGITSPVTSPVTSPAPIAPAYQQLSSQIFPQLQQQQLQAQQLAAQATAAPAQAFAAVETQLKSAPWTTPTTATMPQSKFLDPAGAKAPGQSGWVGGLPQI